MSKIYDFTFFSQKCRYDFLHTLFFPNNSPLQRHEYERTLLFEVTDFEPEKKIKRKGDARFLPFSLI